MWPLLAHALEELAPILAAKPAFIKNVVIISKSQSLPLEVGV
jgi:hypothetical protein